MTKLIIRNLRNSTIYIIRDQYVLKTRRKRDRCNVLFERLIMHVKNVTDICSFPTFFRALHASFNAILTSDQCTPF